MIWLMLALIAADSIVRMHRQVDAWVREVGEEEQ